MPAGPCKKELKIKLENTMDLVQKINELAKAIKETEQYKNYKKAKDKFEEDPEARGLLNEFKKAKSELAILNDGGFDGVEKQRKKVSNLSTKVLEKEEIQKYMKRRKEYQNLVEQVAATLSDKIDFPVNKPKKKSCCR